MPTKNPTTSERDAWKTSPFYTRLTKLAPSDPGVRSLILKVDHIAGQATAISRYVVAFLPQYNDHGERHLNNVLQFMAELAGSNSIQKLSALECALAIMAAMTHDLGMVLDEQEQQAVNDSTDNPTTPEGRAWQTYRDGHPLWHAYQKLPPADRASERARQMLGQVKADYIRDSHAKEFGQPGYNRILSWLDFLAKGQGNNFYRHDGFTFREGLAHLSMSHGQDIGWLPQRLAAADSPYAEVKEDHGKAFACGPDQVNWPWLSWLLRLADVMDCDASRTPRVLFESMVSNPKSQTEWKKHLSLPQRPKFKQHDDQETLLYLCPHCPDPFTEKAIHDILGWINDEVGKVRRERDANEKHFPSDKKLTIELPSKATVRISERGGNYQFLDLHFRLDRDAVMELLMGEALYGEPDLALRELVQNSLDALHLRDLRLKLQRELRKEDDGDELPVPVALADDETLEVQVRWGLADQTQRPCIEVIDNGVGMTREVIERFLTQIGKSYYKSPDFLRERELMKRHGLLCTTISQFGIGFLSAFMLAEDVEIETRSAARGGGLEPGWRVKIHGAHGLIALYPLEEDRVRSTGTRVKLSLKAGLELEPFGREQFLKRLRHLFYGLEAVYEHNAQKPPAESLVEPAWSVARCIVWPLFPVRLQPSGQDAILLDERFHRQELLPLDVAAIRAKAEEWTFPPDSVGDPEWHIWDWLDADTEREGTGSRLRLALPWHTPDEVTPQAFNEVPGRLRRSELLSLAEPQLPVRGRTLVLVNGVLVPEWKEPLAGWLTQVNGVGALLWLDLRGPAAPRLKADRQGLTRRQAVENLVLLLQQRFQAQCSRRSIAAEGWLRLAIGGLPPLDGISGPKACLLGGRMPQIRIQGSWGGAIALLQSLALARDREHVVARTHALALALARERALTLDRYRDRALNRDRPFKSWLSWIEVQLLPEGLQPSLEQAFPPWAIPGWNGPVGQLRLGGPLVLRQPPAPLPPWVEHLDLLVPLTGNPLGPSAQTCPQWATDRWLRPLFTLPFILSEAPEAWRGKAAEITGFLGVESLLVHVPDAEHWNKAFIEIPPEDFGDGPVPEFRPEEEWRNSGVTALWDIPGERVLWAENLRTREEMFKVGTTLDERAKAAG